ncbi:endo-1,4-beta-xylanase [Spirosoma lituiforme]
MSTNQGAGAAIDSNATLKSVTSFPIGAAPGSALLIKNKKIYNLLANQFNAVTVHTYMNIETAPNKFNFSEADYWIKYAETNPIRMHGHCLVYHVAAPDWLTNFSGSTSDFEKVVKNHIQTIVSRYKGKIKSWDVINEIFNDNGTLRTSSFRKLYSSDESYMNFVKNCFIWAHEADPDALLFYNDFNYEISPAKLESVLKMVNNFRAAGIPINGLGTQMHITINTPEVNIGNSLYKLANTGLKIHISELDIKVNPLNVNNFIYSKDIEKIQASKYENIAKLYSQNVSYSQRYGITLWDLSDADSWLVTSNNNEKPTIFDNQYNKKPAYYALLKSLKN